MDFGKGMALKTQIDSKDVSLKAWVGRGRRLKDKEEGCGRKRGQIVRGYQDHLSEISTHSYSAHQARPALPEGLITGLVTSGGPHVWWTAKRAFKSLLSWEVDIARQQPNLPPHPLCPVVAEAAKPRKPCKEG